MKPVESYLCESYRNCCKDPRMVEDESFVCTTSHEGTTTTLFSDETDPSRSMFCEYISGIASPSAGAVRGISQSGCDALHNLVIDFDREECQADFCSSGVSGYEFFLKMMIAAFRRNYYYIAAFVLGLIILQLEQIRILRDLYYTHKYYKEKAEAKEERRQSQASGRRDRRGSGQSRQGGGDRRQSGHSRQGGGDRRQSGHRRKSQQRDRRKSGQSRQSGHGRQGGREQHADVELLQISIDKDSI